MFIRPTESIVRLEARSWILLLNELLKLGKTVLICLIKGIYFTHIVVFIRRLWEASSVIGTEMSTDMAIPGSVCPFCLSPCCQKKHPTPPNPHKIARTVPLGSKHRASGCIL